MLQYVNNRENEAVGLVCRVAASSNNFLHLTGVPLRFTPAGEKYVMTK
jgi:hypothetical protein